MTEPQQPISPLSPSISAEEFSALQTTCQEYLDGWKRAQADYANLHKDVTRERADYAKFANQRLIEQLLPAIDHFEQALQCIPDLTSVPEEIRKPIENWLVGIKAVKSAWSSAFADIGLEQLPEQTIFDPMLHEVVDQEQHPDLPDGQILRTVYRGWSLQGKLLLPSKVILNHHE